MPLIRTCPLSFAADYVAYQRLPDRQVAYHSTGRHPDGKAHDCVESLDAATDAWSAADGVTHELLDPLLSCVGLDDGLLE